MMLLLHVFECLFKENNFRIDFVSHIKVLWSNDSITFMDMRDFFFLFCRFYGSDFIWV